MRVLLIGFVRDILKGMERFLPPGSVVVVEESEVFASRELSGRVADYQCIDRVVLGDYIQSTALLEAVRTEVRDRPVDAVIPANEYAVPAAAVIAAELGLPGAGADVAPRFRDKVLMREAAADLGLRNPDWQEVEKPSQVRSFLYRTGLDEIVLKPADRAGSLGVQILNRTDDIEGAWIRSVDDSEDILLCDRPLGRRFLVERRIDGPEYSVEMLVQHGATVFANVTTKFMWRGGVAVDRGHEVPSSLADPDARALIAATEQLVAGTGFGTGILHAEWFLTDDGPVLVECAARVPGDQLLELIELAYAFNPVEAMVRMLAGEQVVLPRSASQASAIRFLSASPGTVQNIGGVAAAEAVPGVLRVIVDVEVGSIVRPLRSSWSRIGHILAVAQAPSAASAAVEEAVELLSIDSVDRPGTSRRDANCTWTRQP